MTAHMMRSDVKLVAGETAVALHVASIRISLYLANVITTIK
jgi:hypothetical protein